MRYLTIALAAAARWPVLGLLIAAAVIVLTDTTSTLAADALALSIPSKKVILPNGLTVVVSRKDKLPMASISVRFKVGSVYDPEDKGRAGGYDRPSAR